MNESVPEPIMPGETYHVFNKTVGGELMFRDGVDYQVFIVKVIKYILPVSNLFAYSLLPNHFHFLLNIKEEEKIKIKHGMDLDSTIRSAFSRFFISYAKCYNNAHLRRGRLFLQSYKKKLVEDDVYFLTLVNYIHRNPIHHGFAEDYGTWKFTSFNSYLREGPSILDKEFVLSHFESIDEFIAFHEKNKEPANFDDYYLE